MLKILFLFVFGIKAFSFPVVTDVTDPTFSGVENPSVRKVLTGLRLVDFEQYPELKPVYQKLIVLAEKLLIEEDGLRPIRLIFVDDMMPNAFWMDTGGEAQVLAIHLGLLNLWDTDDQMAFTLGHELEHGLSVLGNLPDADSVYARARRPLLQRVVENEVDVKSVFRRIHANGMNPYAGAEVLEKLREEGGDQFAVTHAMAASRINTVEQELTGMTRLIGERPNRQNSNHILSPQVKSFLGSGRFLRRRKDNVEAILTGYQDDIEALLDSVKNLESVPRYELHRARVHAAGEADAILASFSSDKERVRSELYSLIPEAEFLDYQLRHEAAFGKALFEGIAEAFGESVEARTIEQFEIIDNLMRAEIFTNPLMAIGNGDNPLLVIDIQIAAETRDKGVSPEERASRRTSIERNVRRLRATRQVLESGFENLPTAERISSKIEGVRFLQVETPSVHTIEGLQRSFNRQIKHVGNEIQKRNELMEALSLSYGGLIFADSFGDNFETAKSLFKDIPMEKKRKVFPQIFEKNIDYIIVTFIRHSTTESPGSQVALMNEAINKLFGDSTTRYFRSTGYGFDRYISENPDHFRRNMRRLYNAVVEHATDDQLIAIFFGNQADPRMTIPFRYSTFNRTFVLRNDLYGQIVDDEMLHRASRIRFNSFYQNLETSLQYDDLRSLFEILDTYLAEKTAAVRKCGHGGSGGGVLPLRRYRPEAAPRRPEQDHRPRRETDAQGIQRPRREIPPYPGGRYKTQVF